MHYDNYNLHCVISIHALLAESDNINSSVNTADQISIHALLAESDLILHMAHLMELLFLSTLSLRRATVKVLLKKMIIPIISIHALLAESDTWARGSRVTYVISIHALLAESDSRLDAEY